MEIMEPMREDAVDVLGVIISPLTHWRKILRMTKKKLFESPRMWG